MTLYTGSLNTPLGEMLVCSTNKGICLLEFIDTPEQGAQKAHELSLKLNLERIAEQNEHIQQAKTELNEYFLGERKEFEIALDFIGTDFQKQVWFSLLNLPFGTTTSYLKQSQVLGDEKAIRAMASANGKNKIAIVVPCHRVIGSNGELTGYAGGLEKKRWLLEFESEQTARSKQLALF